MRVPSKAVHYGRNRDVSAFRDDRYVKCGRCGMTVNMDRHARASYGFRAGQGISHPDPLTYNSSSTAYNGTGTTYNGRQNDFTITGGCPFCGSYTFDKEEARNGNVSRRYTQS